MNEKHDCPDCGALPGERHAADCDVQRCSVCGQQRIGCDCLEHNPMKSAWTGEWPETTQVQPERPEFLGVAVLARIDPTRPFEVGNIQWRTAVSHEEASVGQELYVGAELRRRFLALEQAGWIQLTTEGRKQLDEAAAIGL